MLRQAASVPSDIRAVAARATESCFAPSLPLDIAIGNVTAAGNSAAVDGFTGKATGTANTYSGVIVDDGDNIGVSIIGGRSGAVGAWARAEPTQRYGYGFGANTDY